MNNRIRSTMEKIAPTQEQKSRMLANIEHERVFGSERAAERKTAAPRFSRPMRIAVIAAVLCCLFCMTAFAEEIGSMFSGMFTKDEMIADTVLTGVYTDGDEHVRMAVEELLSDDCVVRMVVRYQAIDEQGKTWLNELAVFDTETYKHILDAHPNVKGNNIALYGVSHGHGSFELEEYRTETERCFIVCIEAAHNDWGTSEVKLEYPLTAETRSALLDITTNIEKRVIEIDAEIAEGEYYAPTRAIVSPLSFIIEGRQEGLIEKGQDGDYYYQRMKEDVDIESLKLVFTNGTKVNMLQPNDIVNGGFRLGGGNHSHSEDFIIITTDYFKQPIDISTVAGFELDGVYYAF